MAKVNIVVPIYNVYDYLDRNLETLMNQTFTDIKILCINDGSTDKSQEIVDKYVNLDSRFMSFIKKNGGLSDARNYGLKFVDSEYVMFIDSDDFVELNMVEVCVKEMEENGLDMFVFAYNQFCLENNTKEFISLGIDDGIYNLSEKSEILAKTPNAAWNKMYRTKLFKENNIEYPFGYRHQDLGTTAKLLLKSKKIGYKDIALYNYLIDRPNNITKQIDAKIYHIIDMCKEILDYYKENDVYEKYYDELNYLCEINLINSLFKSMKLKDKDFVYKFIDDVFKFKKQYFYRKNNKYQICNTKSDMIYLNKKLCKLYYSMKGGK